MLFCYALHMIAVLSFAEIFAHFYKTTKSFPISYSSHFSPAELLVLEFYVQAFTHFPSKDRLVKMFSRFLIKQFVRVLSNTFILKH